MPVRIVVRNVLTEANPAEATYSFDKHLITLGRHEGCDIPLQDRSVSRDHARIYFEKGEWKVEDVGSSRGTLLNERNLVAYEAKVLHPGDAVVISPYRIELFVEADPWNENTPPSLGGAEGEESVTSALRSDFLRWMDQNFGGEPPSLLVLDGHAAGREIRLEDLGRDTLLGRGLDCSFAFEDESVSRHHARLRRGVQGVEILDLDSRNHIAVNGQIVKSAVLRSGDEVRLGKVRLKFKDPVSSASEDAAKPDRHAQTTANVEVDQVWPKTAEDSDSFVVAPLRPLEVPLDLTPARAGVGVSEPVSAKPAAAVEPSAPPAVPLATRPAPAPPAQAATPSPADEKPRAAAVPSTPASTAATEGEPAPAKAAPAKSAAASQVSRSKGSDDESSRPTPRPRKAAAAREVEPELLEPERSALLMPLLVAFFAVLMLAAIVMLALLFR